MGSPNPDKGRQLKMKADQAYAQRKWKKALEMYEKAQGHLVGDVRVAQRVADSLRKLNRNDEAVEQYKTVASQFANSGFWAKAIAINKMILDLDPSDVTVQKSLAEMYSAQKESSNPGSMAMSNPGGEPPTPAAPPKYEEVVDHQAISISEADPISQEASSSDVDLMLGGTVSIAEDEPRKMDEAPISSAPPQEEARMRGLAEIPLFSEMSSDEVFAILEKLSVRRYPKEALVCEEGDLGNSMYIIADGQALVFARDENGNRITLTTLCGGDFFGEFGLLTNGQRNASVQAESELELLEITSTDFDKIAAKHPRVWSVLEDHLQRRMIDTILKKSDVFEVLNQNERDQLAKLMEIKKVGPSSVIMQQGTDGEEMYIIKAGSVSVLLEKNSKKAVVKHLGAGEYFGEVAMLTGKPRTATIQSRTDCELFCLRRANAASVFKHNKEVLERLRNKMNQRTRETHDVAQSFNEASSTLDMV